MPTAIITGASRGLGYALATELAATGWNLVIDARHADALTAAADRLRRAAAAGATITAVPGDITSATHRDALVATAATLGPLDLLVNNAGTLGPSPLPSGYDLDPAELRDVLETNVVAPHALTRAALPLLRRAHGIVIDVTSDAAVEAYPGWSGYGASKAATEQLRYVLGAEETDVTVWRVDPGDLRTDMHQRAFPGEDISDRPLPESVAPGLSGLLARRPESGRYRLADFASQDRDIAVVAVVGNGSGAGTPAGVRGATDPIALWLTIEVDDFAAGAAFYRDVIGLPEIDGWSDDGSIGAVFAVGPAGRVEIERPRQPSPGARVAIEFPGVEALTAAHDRIAAHPSASVTPVVAHARGHSGFSVHDPRGTELYLWSEK
jgi:NAD(P)-dependent dehydrogenase (short-subunit alcohol dehydrogenase family)